MDEVLNEIELLHSQIKEDLDFSDLNMLEKSMRLIAKKHAYVGVLMRKKRDIMLLERKKDELMSKIKDAINGDAIVSLRDKQIEKRASENDVIKKIDEKIKDIKLIVELLDHTVKNFSEASYTIKSITDLMKLEQQ